MCYKWVMMIKAQTSTEPTSQARLVYLIKGGVQKHKGANQSTIAIGVHPLRTWSTLTSDFSAPNHCKDIKLVVCVPKIVCFYWIYLFEQCTL